MAKPESADHKAYRQAGIAEKYGPVAGNLNLFMICEKLNEKAFRRLPEGYSFRLCHRGELEIWKRIQADNPEGVGYLTEFFQQVYAKNEDEFFRRCTFVCDNGDIPAAACFIWPAYGSVNTVAWFKTLPGHEGKGLGRALLGELLEPAQCPVYLHTQPTSVCAIKLYADFGFKLITDAAVGYRKNDLDESLPLLKQVMREEDYAKLEFTETDGSLHRAALTSELAEF
jgi:GNAT superfamily N-acetyltransferase